MKIVLRQDVPKVGEAGTIQTVADGYARNYLIPQGFAVVATDGEIKTATHNLAVKERKIARQEEAQRALSEKIQGKVLKFSRRAGSHGRLYGSVTAVDVATELSALVGEEIDRRRVVLEDPLRTVGEHTVTVHLVGRLRPQVSVVIEAEASGEDEGEPVSANSETSEDAE